MSNNIGNRLNPHRKRAGKYRPEYRVVRGTPCKPEEDLNKDPDSGEEIIDLLGGLLLVWLCDILSVVRNTCSIVSATWLKALGEGKF